MALAGCGGTNTGNVGQGVPMKLKVESGSVLGVMATETSVFAAFANLESSRSNLKRFVQGVAQDVFTSGGATVSQIYKSGDEVFVAFDVRYDLATSSATGDGCLLARAKIGAEVSLECVDSTLKSLVGTLDTAQSDLNDTVQVDGQGGIYYLGYVEAANASGRETVLRRYANGTVSDLINSGIDIEDFAVTPAGDVFVVGRTTATSTDWVRKISAAGSVTTLFEKNAWFVRLFPDGNIYFGTNESEIGMFRYLTASQTLDGDLWIGCANSYTNCHYDGDTVLTYGTSYKKFFESNDRVFGIDDRGLRPGLFALYPTPAAVPLVGLSSIRTGASAGSDRIVLAGVKASGVNGLLAYNVGTAAETDLLGANNVEVYQVSASAQKVYFEGLRFSDNAFVVGEVGVDGTGLTVVATGSAAKLKTLTYVD